MNKLERWLTAWIDIAGNIAFIFTLTYFSPAWGLRFVGWRCYRRNLKKDQWTANQWTVDRSREEAQEQPTPWGL